MASNIPDTGSQTLNALAFALNTKAINNGADVTVSLSQIVGSPTVGDAVANIYNPTAIGTDVAGQKLLTSELAYFAKWYFNQFVKPAPAGYLRDFFDSKFTVGLIGLLHAKANVGNKGTYGGPGKSLHTQAIRPITATASGVNGGTTPSQSWNQSSVTAGWNTGFFNLDMTKSSTTGDLNLQNQVEMMVFGLADFNVSPKVLEYQFNENGNKPLGTVSNPLNNAQDGDAIDLGVESYIVPVNQKYTVDINFGAGGASVPVVIGIQYVSDTYFGQE